MKSREAAQPFSTSPAISTRAVSGYSRSLIPSEQGVGMTMTVRSWPWSVRALQMAMVPCRVGPGLGARCSGRSTPE